MFRFSLFNCADRSPIIQFALSLGEPETLETSSKKLAKSLSSASKSAS